MFARFALILSLVLTTPTVAWACMSSKPVELLPLDFLMFGVTTGVAYRLFLQWAVKASQNVHSAVYLSLLVASFGAGLVISGEISWESNGFAVIAMVLAALGAFYPKKLVLRLLLLVPVFLVSAVCSMATLTLEKTTGCTFSPLSDVAQVDNH